MLESLNTIIANDPTTEKTSFEVTDANKAVLIDLKNYLAREPGRMDYRKGILFTGSVGTGKTILLEMIKQCFDELWNRELSIFTAPYIKQQFYADPTDNFSMAYMVQNYRFLGINDLGLEQTTGRGGEILRDILFERYEKRMFTFVTTNMSIREFYKRYEYPDNVGRMNDRFKTMFNYVTLSGVSFR